MLGHTKNLSNGGFTLEEVIYVIFYKKDIK